MNANDNAADSSLVEPLKKGDPEAGNELARRFTAPLVQFVRNVRMSREIRARVDPEDVVQEVFRSVIVRIKRGTFHCSDDAELWRVLCIRAFKALLAARRAHRRARRDLRREMSGSDAGARDVRVPPEPADPHLGPLDVAIAHDEFWAATDAMTPEESVLVYMRLDGYSIGQIVRLTGYTPSKVKRLLAQAHATASHRNDREYRSRNA